MSFFTMLACGELKLMLHASDVHGVYVLFDGFTRPGQQTSMFQVSTSRIEVLVIKFTSLSFGVLGKFVSNATMCFFSSRAGTSG